MFVQFSFISKTKGVLVENIFLIIFETQSSVKLNNRFLLLSNHTKNVESKNHLMFQPHLI